MRLIGIVILIIVVMASESAADELADYWRLLNSVSGRLKAAIQMERRKPGSAHQTLSQIADSLPNSVNLQTEDRTIIKTDLSWIKNDLREIEKARSQDCLPKIENLLERVDTLIVAKPQGPNTPLFLKKARVTLSEVLQQQEYRESFVETLIRRMLDRISDVLSRWLGPGIARVLSWILGITIGVGCAILLVKLAILFLKQKHPQRTKGVVSREEQISPPVKLTIETLIEQAERDASEHRYRDALRNVYLAAMLLLDKAGLLEYTESRTNWEHTRSLARKSPEAANILSSMTLRFDELIYGQRTVESSDYRDNLNMFRKLETMI